MSNSLDPDQAQQNVGPDLGPNCLQRFPAVKSFYVLGKQNLFHFVVGDLLV